MKGSDGEGSGRCPATNGYRAASHSRSRRCFSSAASETFASRSRWDDEAPSGLGVVVAAAATCSPLMVGLRLDVNTGATCRTAPLSKV